MDNSSRPRLLTLRIWVSVWALLLGCGVIWGGDFVTWNYCLTVMGLAAAIYYSGSGSARPVPVPALFRWAVFLYPCYVVFQLVPLPVFLLRILSPERYRMLEALAAFGGVPAFAPISSVPAQTWEHLLRIAGYTLTFFVLQAVVWKARKEREWLPALCLLGIAALEVALGLLKLSSGSPDDVLQGTYTNRNHFAGLLEMAIPFSVAYAFAKFAEYGALATLKSCVSLFAGALLFGGVVLSASKSGFVGALAGVFAVAAMAILSRLSRERRYLALIGLGVCFLGSLFLLPHERVVQGVGEIVAQGTETDLEGRWPVWKDSLRLLAAYPVFGSGLGTYPSVFPKYQTSSVDLFIVHAHNDFLEFASDLGIAGAAILFVLFATAFRAACRAALYHRSLNMRHLGMGCLGGMCAIFLHSLTDFNMFHRGNAMCLTWITAIAMGLGGALEPDEGEKERELPAPRGILGRIWNSATGGGPWLGKVSSRGPALILCLLLLIYAPAWIVFETYFRTDPVAEKKFCQWGICDTDALLSSQTTPEKGYAAASLADLEESVRREPGSQLRWHYLCEALKTAGKSEQAAFCVSKVMELAPEHAGQNTLLARFYASLDDGAKALELSSRVLRQTALYDSLIFASFKEHRYPVTKVLESFPPGNRAPKAYLRALIEDGDIEGARLVWNWIAAHKYGDTKAASEYTAFLIRKANYQEAAKIWAADRAGEAPEYLVSNHIFNGGFENPSLNSPFDWRMDRIDGVVIDTDSSLAWEGRNSTRIRFDGKENVDFRHLSQQVYLGPGAYRFQAYIRTEEITGANGVGFVLDGRSGSAQLSTLTKQLTGTNGWTKIEESIQVPRECSLTVAVRRERVVLKFDAKIGGTVWIDGVRLTKLR